MKTTEWYENNISPSLLFFSTLSCFPLFLFQKILLFQWVLVFFFLLSNLFRKGKIKILPSVFIFISITFFALLVPNGKVLFSLSNFHITEGALKAGIKRSGILLGMLYISQYSISKNLALPGTIGCFISQMFSFFNQLTESKLQFSSKKIDSILHQIDERLCNVYFQNIENEVVINVKKKAVVKTTAFGFVIAFLPLFLSALLFCLQVYLA
jgi:hypothetical protein